MSKDSDLRRIMEREQFLELVASGVRPLRAGIEVGWSPHKTRRELKDPDFAELVSLAEDQLIEDIEATLFAQAKRGNMTAIQMVLYNKRPDEWRDVKRIEIQHDTKVQIGVIHSVKAAAAELLREKGVAAVQQLVAGDSGQGEVVDAEIIDE